MVNAKTASANPCTLKASTRTQTRPRQEFNTQSPVLFFQACQMVSLDIQTSLMNESFGIHFCAMCNPAWETLYHNYISEATATLYHSSGSRGVASVLFQRMGLAVVSHCPVHTNTLYSPGGCGRTTPWAVELPCMGVQGVLTAVVSAALTLGNLYSLVLLLWGCSAELAVAYCGCLVLCQFGD